jgi:hypothetical protein
VAPARGCGHGGNQRVVEYRHSSSKFLWRAFCWTSALYRLIGQPIIGSMRMSLSPFELIKRVECDAFLEASQAATAAFITAWNPYSQLRSSADLATRTKHLRVGHQPRQSGQSCTEIPAERLRMDRARKIGGARAHRLVTRIHPRHSNISLCAAAPCQKH